MKMFRLKLSFLLFALVAGPLSAQSVTFETFPKDAVVNVGSGAPEGYTPVGQANQPVDLSGRYEQSVLKIVITADGRKPWIKTFTSGELQPGTYGEEIYLHPQNPLLYVVDFPRAFPLPFILLLLVGGGAGFYLYREESRKRRHRKREEALWALGKEYEKDYGDYILIKDLGQGGMGLVRLGLRKGSLDADGLVAVKTMILDHPMEVSNTEADENDLSRFRREAKILQVANHPNIVKIYEWGERDKQYYIVMEHLTGQDLKEYLQEKKTLPLEEVREIFSQIASALDYLHQREVFHRDMKLSNIRRIDSGRVKILDFGLATSSDQSRNVTQEGAIIGTLDYMAPEHFAGRKQDAFYDQFSTGVILFELLTGRMPMKDSPSKASFNELFMHYTAARCPIRDFLPDLAPEVAAVIDRMLEVDPVKRFGSIKEAHEAFEKACESSKVREPSQ